MGSRARAFDALAEALTLAEPENHVRRFVEKGEDLANLLRSVASQGVAPEFVRCILSQPGFGDQPGSGRGTREAAQPRAALALIEPLSERELEVLRLIAGGLSNKEVAERLVIATSTVKSHANHIYGKLGVRSRTQAIALAQELGIL
jgi:LuxR family maltose regulon positive regulatory protein